MKNIKEIDKRGFPLFFRFAMKLKEENYIKARIVIQVKQGHEIRTQITPYYKPI